MGFASHRRPGRGRRCIGGGRRRHRRQPGGILCAAACRGWPCRPRPDRATRVALMADPVRTIKPRPWMRDAATRRVMRALTAPDAAPRFVGGAVRDTLLGRQPREIDIATPLAPDAVMRRLSAAGIRAVPTGIAHGTVTAATAKQTFEITTLRRDVETDGRHAKVAFGVD